MATFAERFKSLRKTNNFTQSEIATKLEVSVSTISMYENGHRVPPLNSLTDIATFFDVDVEYLIGIQSERRVDRSLPLQFSPKELNAIISKEFINANNEKGYNIHLIHEFTNISYQALEEIFASKYKQIDYNIFKLADFFNLLDSDFFKENVFSSSLSEKELSHGVGIFFLEMFENYMDSNNIDLNDYDDSDSDDPFFPIFQDTILKKMNLENTKQFEMIFTDPLSIDVDLLETATVLMDFNIQFKFILNAVLYYFVIPNEYYMGYSMLPFEEFNFDWYLEDLNSSIEEYVYELVSFIKNKIFRSNIFDKFTDSIYELSDKIPSGQEEAFYNEVLSYATFLANSKK